MPAGTTKALFTTWKTAVSGRNVNKAQSNLQHYVFNSSRKLQYTLFVNKAINAPTYYIH